MPIFLSPVQAFPSRYSTPGLGHREPLANGEAGTAQTIAMMRRLVLDAMRDSAFVRKAIDIVRAAGVAPYDDLGEVRAIYDWTKRNIRFTKDPTTVEKLYPPQELLKIRAGDCDDLSIFILAATGALGYPGRLVTVATAQEDPSEFTHVFPEVETPPRSGNWIALDAARLDSQFGLEPQTYYRKRAWDIATDAYKDLAGSKHKMPRFLSGYIGIGQDDGGWANINWQPIVQTAVSDVPAIIAATTGRGSATSPYGSYTSGVNPYLSFQTPYSPGYGLPTAGYTAGSGPSAALTLGASSDMLPLLLIGGIALLMLSGR